MKRATKITALLLAVIMVFTGCATVEQTTVINSDGSAKVTSVVDVDKEQLDAAVKKMGYNNPEAYVKSWLVDGYYNDTESGYYEIVTIDGKQYYEIRNVTGVKAKYLAENVNYALGVSSKGLYITKDTVYGVVDELDYDLEEALGELKPLGFNNNSLKMKLIFEFPANIVTSTGTIDKTNAKKVTFNIGFGKKSTIFATTNKANTYNSIKKKVDKLNTVKKPVIKSLKVKKVKKKKVTATLKLKKMKDVRYEIMYSTSKKFHYMKTQYKDTKKTTVTLKNLKKGKKYYVCVRVYKYNYAGKELYSKYAKTTIKIKK
ncbi:MAG: fibronectin type III domain-containing protein [Eubacterium sp.]